MINFTPPIKVSLFISLVYLLCFQFFLQSANLAWLYSTNIVFFICSVLYVLFLNKTMSAKFNMLVLTGKGIKLSFISSLISFAGATIIFLLNYYFFSESKPSYTALKNVKEAIAIVFANAFLVNFVFGSLGAFLTAGLMNEKNHEGNSGALRSVKH